MAWNITWWENTGKMTEYIDSISSPIYRNMQTNEELSWRDLPIGACFEVLPNPKFEIHRPLGYDDKCIVCKLPSGHNWYIDGRASNCTMPNDTEHRCWLRHGSVGDKLTVNKQGGKTCAAGAGSIVDDEYYRDKTTGKLEHRTIFHGFLTDGVLK